MKKISIIIPTLNRFDFLSKLINPLNRDNSIGEITIINNIQNKPISTDFDKLKVITPNKTLSLCQRINMGVDFSECEIIGVLEKDIILPNGFCSSLIQKLPEKFGLIVCSEEILNNSDFKIETIKNNLLDFNLVAVMFFKKSLYVIII